MKEIDPDLAAHLAGGATTLCQCWRVTRRDGTVLGFTEHDEDLVFAGTRFLAASGFSATQAEAEAGLAAPTGEVAGGFSHHAISEADLAAGRYDGAEVEVFIVNWQAPDQHLMLKVQEIGEVTREAGRFSAELRGIAHRLGRDGGRVYNRRCDAALGDARCRVDLTLPGRHGSGHVAAVFDSGRIRVTGLEAWPDDAFRFGRLRLTSGEAAGLTAEVEANRAADGASDLQFWLPLAALPAPGDGFTITIGCDKRFATCRDRFANTLNFRGFPHVPGSDFAYSYADGTSLHDGSPLFP